MHLYLSRPYSTILYHLASSKPTKRHHLIHCKGGHSLKGLLKPPVRPSHHQNLQHGNLQDGILVPLAGNNIILVTFWTVTKYLFIYQYYEPDRYPRVAGLTLPHLLS
ncbi:hypothetical protein CROQUDRAFT_655726 [Cronartium quercuum f. sp. fusiforme G11]|uniref:Uncharacterized protein n=1 Tax=Cronartium quercuum f. sp. fusiforme G11 TaxID=708437 RepID=A0A9P6NKP7_9BASI|nr:hypothetical protein CROQUDRAFT_655726 [Cronartium quercuum f. sp. fusiforme G11]